MAKPKKTRTAPPYFPCFSRDFVHAIRVADMTPAEVGHLFLVMCQQWENQGPLSLDPAKYAAFSGWDIRVARGGLARLKSLGKITVDETGIATGRQAEEIARYQARVRAAEEREAKRRNSKDRPELPGEVFGDVPEKSETSFSDLFENGNEINEGATTAAALPDSRHQTPEVSNTPLPPEGGARAKSKRAKKGRTKAEPLQIQQAYEAYCEFARNNGKAVPRRTPKLESTIGARLGEFGLDGWMRAVANIERSRLLMGDRAFSDGSLCCVTIVMVTRPDNFAKLHDGGYGNDRKPRPKPGATKFDLAQWRAPLARQVAERKNWDPRLPSTAPYTPGYCVPKEIHDELKLGEHYAEDGSGRFVFPIARHVAGAPLNGFNGATHPAAGAEVPF